MNIKKVYLENIRSYKEAEIEFPDGKVLLSGDIGAGKSSVLLGVEFALFGLLKGSLSGNSLLRNGADYGKVRVNFNIDNNDVVIERRLKRSKTGVSQDAVSIMINDEKKEVAISELKNYVLKLLNYPQEFMSKNPVLYRYTVYTPQEEMKQILVENADVRLDTLRRVFAIDKYKRIQDNVKTFMTKLGETVKNREGIISDLEQKKESAIIKKQEREKVDLILKEILPIAEKAGAEVHARKNELADIESKLKEIEVMKRGLIVAKNNVEEKRKQLEKSNERLSELEKEIEKTLGKKTDDVKGMIKSISENIERKNSTISGYNLQINDISRRQSVLETKKDSVLRLKNSLISMDSCPTCRQKVSDEYKRQIIDKSSADEKIFTEDMKTNAKKTKDISNLIEKEKKELRDLQEKEKRLAKADASIDEIEKRKSEIAQMEMDIKVNSDKYIEIHEKIKNFKEVEEKSEQIKKKVDEAQENFRKVEVRKAEINSQLKSYNLAISELENEIKNKESVKSEIEKYNRIKNWLDGQFIQLVSVIEKNVMMKLHQEFTVLFEKWFNMLVASEGLRARLDENFTPVIEQAGFDIDYSFLSGGERTAAALAYRLALNQVINSLLSHIKTNDLLILDEPTDGFSSEQLDKMKDVLSEIKAKQIILVSHESKIENFVDNIIRFSKEGHISRIK